MNGNMMPTRSSMGCSLDKAPGDEPLKLDESELSDIEFLARNEMHGRITLSEILELVRVYRKALGAIPA